MKVDYYKGGIIHLRFASQDEVTRAMVRLQEFYESPIEAIRGKFFTHEAFEFWYGQGKTLAETYYKEWNGFNIPGHAVHRFFVEFGFDRLTEVEKEIFGLTVGGPFNDFYLIATWNDETVRHEIAHGLYYLNDDYHSAVQRLLQAAPACVLGKIAILLLKWGYDKSVLPDEFNAYLSTETEAWWSEDDGAGALSVEDATLAWKAGEPFRALLKAKIKEINE